MGYMYEVGLGVPMDLREAARWYRLAAEQGDSYSQTRLGYLHEKGLGVARDDALAAKWYAKSTAAGDKMGQSWLGTMYRDGRGFFLPSLDGLIFRIRVKPVREKYLLSVFPKYVPASRLGMAGPPNRGDRLSAFMTNDLLHQPRPMAGRRQCAMSELECDLADPSDASPLYLTKRAPAGSPRRLARGNACIGYLDEPAPAELPYASHGGACAHHCVGRTDRYARHEAHTRPCKTTKRGNADAALAGKEPQF